MAANPSPTAKSSAGLVTQSSAEGKQLMSAVADKTRNRLVDNTDSKSNLKNYNFNNKKRNKGGLLGLNSLDQSSVPTGDINDRFVNACENGDYPTVIRILDVLKDFNIDVTDNLGRTALRLAVENEHLEVVQALLAKSDSQKVREALLLAIYLGHIQIAESILRHPKYKVLSEKKFVNGDQDSFWQTPSSDDAQFSPDITPVILAAQYNRTEIVQILLLNGDRIIKPHDFQCKCNECSNKFKFDSLRHAQSRLNAYRGLASEAYISLASIDPILTAFELGHELRILSDKEKYFKNEYNQLADNLSAYAVKLLNNVRGRDELEIVLNKTGKETEEKYERLARLDLALKYQEKPFVAHSNCQQKLVEIWYSGIRKIAKMNNLVVVGIMLLFIITMPFYFILYILAPKYKISRFLCQPCVKFIAHTITYLVFIGMIIVSSLQFASEESNRERFSDVFPKFSNIFKNYSSQTHFRYRFAAPDFYIRASLPSDLDYAINVFILGFCWHEAKQIYQDGINDYLLQWNNICDSCMNILYISSFALKYYTMFMVRIHAGNLESDSFWSTVANLSTTDTSKQIEVYTTFYWLNDDRYYWDALDPINMAEGLFALANIFSICRICFLLPANQTLGPLQISLGKMFSDIMKFIYIFLIIFAAFMFALNNLFWYYQLNTRKHVEIVQHLNEDNSTTNAEQYFGTIDLTFQTIFWAIFGLGSSDYVRMSPFKNSLTENFGFALYGSFHIASIIVLLNMLIAMMTKSYEDILRHSDIEWKFSRSKLYMEFIKDGATLPVPFNIIPTPKSLYYLTRKAARMVCYCCFKKPADDNNVPQNELDGELPNRNAKSQDNNLTLPDTQMQKMNGGKNGAAPSAKAANGDNVRRVSLGGNDLTYTKVMQRIIKRFLLHKQRESDDVKESDFDELKQDLQMVRYEMLNDIKRSGDETIKYISLIHNGISVIGDEILKDSDDSELFMRFKEYRYNDSDVFKTSFENIDSETGSNHIMASFDKSTDELYDSSSLKKSWPQIQGTSAPLVRSSFIESSQSEGNLVGLIDGPGYLMRSDSTGNDANIDDIECVVDLNGGPTKSKSLSELGVINEEEENSVVMHATLTAHEKVDCEETIQHV